MKHDTRESHTLAADSDDLLLARYLLGDEHACALIVQRYQSSLIQFISHQLRNTADDGSSWDVLQHVWIQMHRSLPMLAAGSRVNQSIRPWLLHVAKNCCMDELRKRSRKAAISLELAQEGEDKLFLQNIIDPQLLPEEIVEQQEMYRELVSLIALLPLKARSIVLLRLHAGYTFIEIEAHLHIPASTAKTYFHRARQQLQKALLSKGVDAT